MSGVTSFVSFYTITTHNIETKLPTRMYKQLDQSIIYEINRLARNVDNIIQGETFKLNNIK